MNKSQYSVVVVIALFCFVNSVCCQDMNNEDTNITGKVYYLPRSVIGLGCVLELITYVRYNYPITDLESRTFGHHFLKRISFALIPAAFIVGVITTLLAALTVVSIKGLGVGIILLVIAFGQILSRALPAALPLSASTQYQAPYPVVYSQRQDPLWIEQKPAW